MFPSINKNFQLNENIINDIREIIEINNNIINETIYQIKKNYFLNVDYFSLKDENQVKEVNFLQRKKRK